MRKLTSRALASFAMLVPLVLAIPRAVAQVKIENHHLVLDGTPQPQLFGAELQYFRLRGGYEKNIPREKVIALWNEALSRMVEAKMNSVSFYIPWDFHEYAEGKFDFTGTADEDGDGRPDYPSRDLKTFFMLIEKHGLKKIMARPGPYINAEWGFLGFGAIPEWFHDKYPDSHMQTSWGWPTRLYDYHNPDLLRHTQLWFQRLYDDVLKEQIGPGRPVVFMQIDNETNYQWSSIYNHDYGPRSVLRYQNFLKAKYGTLQKLNLAHGQNWQEWALVRPPAVPYKNINEDQDWYRFSDNSLTSYLEIIRRIWESIGVKEPDVLFTLAESFNAFENGMLPNYAGRNLKDRTGLMTVNLYPKTDESGHPFLNFPFKSDLDVKSAESANDAYLGSRQEWVLGPEIQGGWWRGTNVEPAARLQTYLTVLGHGMKALYVYYFNEGQNWDVEWGYKKTLPLLRQLQKEWKVEDVPLSELTNEFWGELQSRSDRTIVGGIDVRRILQQDPLENRDLYFDAPLDKNAQPREHFYQLKAIGEKLIAPYSEFLARAVALEDSVALVRDNEMHIPTGQAGFSGITTSSEWFGGLLGYTMNASLNPSIVHGDLSPSSPLQERILFHLDTGKNAVGTLRTLQQSLMIGATVVNFIDNKVAVAAGFPVKATPTWGLASASVKSEELTYYTNSRGEFATGREPDAKTHSIPSLPPLFVYDLSFGENAACSPLLHWKSQVVGYRCTPPDNAAIGPKGQFYQFGVHFFKDYNSGIYGQIQGEPSKKRFLTALLKSASVEPSLQLSKGASSTVVFARRDPLKKLLWVTIKTGAAKDQELRLKASPEVLARTLPRSSSYTVFQPLEGKRQLISYQELTNQGLKLSLKAKDSTVLVLEAGAAAD